MHPTGTRLATLALATAFAATSLIANVPAAEAASPCPGTRVGKYQLYAGGEVADHMRHGYIEVWYSSARGGTNCVLVYDNAAGRHRMTVQAGISGKASRSDSGRYYTYAGPITFSGTDRTCISLYAEVINGGTSYRRAMNRVHCG